MQKTGIKKDVEEIKKMLRGDENDKKKKKFKLPMKAKVSKRKLREGYATVEVIHENRNVDFIKVPIIDSTIRIGDTFHALNDLDVYWYKGKPIIHQPKIKSNPWNPLSGYIDSERVFKEGEGKTITLNPNETRGHKYIMARMKSDMIRSAKKIGWGMSIFGLVILGIVLYALFTG